MILDTNTHFYPNSGGFMAHKISAAFLSETCGYQHPFTRIYFSVDFDDFGLSSRFWWIHIARNTDAESNMWLFLLVKQWLLLGATSLLVFVIIFVFVFDFDMRTH